MIRDTIKTDLVAAMKAGERDKVATLRLIQAAIKNRDIELRTATSQPDDDAMVTEVLQKMIKQRRESAELFRKGGAEDRAATEEAEIDIVSTFLPTQLSDAEAAEKIRAIIDAEGASSMKDMGRVMAAVKAQLGTAIEPARASAMVKAALAG